MSLHPIFMYGSNLDPQRLGDRLLDWDGSFQVAQLFERELRFNKRSIVYGVAANVVSHPSRSVWGIVVHLSATDRALMDRIEGLGDRPKQYDRHPAIVRLQQGATVAVDLYIAHPTRIVEGLQPSEEYLNYVVGGARHCGLPLDYVQAIARLGSKGVTSR